MIKPEDWVATLVADRFVGWKRQRQGLEQRWHACWQAYLCQLDEKSQHQDARSKIVRPVLYQAVEAIHANLLNALFPADERFFSGLGDTEADCAQAAQIEVYLRTLLEKANFTQQYGQFLKQALITGNSVAAIPWRHTVETQVVYQPKTLLGVTVGSQKTLQPVVTYQGPVFEVLDMFDVVLDPDETDFAQTMLIRRLTRSLHDVLACPAYTCLTDEGKARLRQFAASSNRDNASHDTAKQAKRKASGLDAQPEIGTQAAVTLLEAWGHFQNGSESYPNMVATVALLGDMPLLLRFEPNPFEHGQKPFVFTQYIPVPNEVYGIGAIEKSLGLQNTINTLTNQKLDVINLGSEVL